MTRIESGGLDMKEGEGIRTAVDVFLLDQTKSHILLGLRTAQAGINTWGFPGGHQKTGEKILETAKRELREELGPDFQVNVTSKIIAVRENVIPPWYVQHNTVVVEGIYMCGKYVLPEDERNVQFKWFELDNLPENLFSGVGEVINAYKQHKAKIVTDWQESS